MRSANSQHPQYVILPRSHVLSLVNNVGNNRRGRGRRNRNFGNIGARPTPQFASDGFMICRFWLSGTCMNGRNCKFTHYN